MINYLLSLWCELRDHQWTKFYQFNSVIPFKERFCKRCHLREVVFTDKTKP